MPGIYIHIPYCVQACHYCDFHFSTNQKTKISMIDMIVHEIELQKDYLSDKNISTIYFGGGTPSLLDHSDLKKIMQKIQQHFSFSNSTEITLEANPDDLTEEKLLTLKNAGINRLSIGIQTFDNEQLAFMNRAHNSEQALNSVKLAQISGFENISIDLIYGIPSSDHTIWKTDLAKALSLNIQHISSYCLTIEPSTVFGKRKEKGTLPPEDEEYNAQQYEILIDTLNINGFEQYEVSNFSQPGFLSKHNSNYWKNEHYLGIGPGAHSYNGKSRQFNIENNNKYISSLSQNIIPFKIEILDSKTMANEYIMTRLRTKWGIDVNFILSQYGIAFDYYKNTVDKYHKMGFIEFEKPIIKLTKKGLLFADKITEDLFII